MFKNLNSMFKNLNLSKTLLVTPTHGLLIRITHLVPGLRAAQVVYVPVQKGVGTPSARGKVLGKK